MKNEDAAKMLDRIRYEGDWTADAFNALTLAISTLKPKKKKLIVERQAFVTWYTPEEKVPKDGEITLVTVSGKDGDAGYDHAFALAEYWHDEGWDIYGASDKADLTVLAWCDIKPYGG